MRRSCASVLPARGRRTSAVTTSDRPTASSWEASGSEGWTGGEKRLKVYMYVVRSVTFIVLLYWEVHGREDVLEVSQLQLSRTGERRGGERERGRERGGIKGRKAGV